MVKEGMSNWCVLGMYHEVPHRLKHELEYIEVKINKALEYDDKYLCAWGNDAASEVLTEARLLLVENYFQTPS